MATGGMIGDGVKVAYSIGSPMAWTEVIQLADIDFPGMVADDVGNDVHGSAGFHRSMPGLFAVEDFTFTVTSDFDEVTNVVQNALWGLRAQKTTIWWLIELPTNRAKTKFVGFEFQGYVAGIVPNAPIDERQDTVYTVRFDGVNFGRVVAGSSQL